MCERRNGRAGRATKSARARTVIMVLLCALMTAACADPAARGDLTVALPAGATSLLDIGAYRIGYQRTGADAMWLPDGWTGHFTDDAGVAFMPGLHSGKPSLLLHCPWRGGTGPAFVDYALTVPAVKPVKLAFGIAMRPDVATVDGEVVRSDGVTFTVALTAAGKTTELVHEHYSLATPKPFEFDLSALAGEQILLRLQAEPGAKMNASFDFSYFVDPRITVGSATASLSAAVSHMTDTAAYRVLSKASLVTLSNRSGRGITPSCKLEHENVVEHEGSERTYRLVYAGADCRLVYDYAAQTGALDDLTARLDDTEPFRPCSGGGVFFADGPPEHAELVSARIDDGTALAVCWRYRRGSETATVMWTFRPVGKALVIAAASEDLTVARLSLGRVGGAGLRRAIPTPYLFLQAVSYLPEQRAFAMSYMDWTASHASQTPGAEARYIPKLDGKRNALNEVGYVAVSPDMDEVLPNIPHPPSPYLELLGPKMMLDMWTGEPFDASARWLETYKSVGIDELAIIYHVWQRYGYDVKLPDHIPADPRMGGDEKMRILGSTAQRLGYVFSLHENYIDLYPDAPSYTEDAAARDPKGTFWKAWYHKGTKVQSWGLRPVWALKYAEQNSPEIHRRHRTNAAYLDVHTCIEPWRYCDYDPGQPLAGKAACRREWQAKLFQYLRDVHGGPLFGEGYRHLYWAGLVDGVEAQVDGGEDCPALVSFDLLKLHPQMVNHGMGYYTRWLRTRRETKWGVDAPTPAQLDKYRAQELAYGHAAFVGNPLYYNLPHVIREYHLVQPVQARYGDARVTEIRYDVAGQMVTGSVAAVTGVLDRLRVKYDSGLTLSVNLRADDWQVGTVSLPQFGFVAEAPGLLAYTAYRDGVIADFARTQDSLFVDSRAEVTLPWAYRRKRIEPRVKALEYVGGNQFTITYEWLVNDTLERDLHCFVHFQDMTAQDTHGGIIFQNDHEPPQPTTGWQPGAAFADGPHAVTIPTNCTQDELHILVGLHQGGRVPLQGVSAGEHRIAVGRLLLTRKEDGAVTDVRLGDIEELRREQEHKQARFSDRMNAKATKVDVGVAATDGSFKLLARPYGFDLLPFPRDKHFSVELDLATLAPGKFTGELQATGLDASGKEVGSVAAAVKGGKAAFALGLPGAVRYRLEGQ